MLTKLKRSKQTDNPITSNFYSDAKHHDYVSDDEDVITQHITPIMNMLSSYRKAINQIKQEHKVFIANRTRIVKQSSKKPHLKSGDQQADQETVHCRPQSGLSIEMNDLQIDKLDEQIYELTNKINKMLK